MARRWGLDLDGVVCNFDDAFLQLLQEVTGRELAHPGNPTHWDWPQHVCGCSNKEVSEAWRRVREAPEFWYSLKPLNREDIYVLQSLQREMDTNIYFITSRMPDAAKWQTEKWLRDQGIVVPTVLLSSDKGWVAKGLQLTAFIDDKPENLADVIIASPKTNCYLKKRTFNEPYWSHKGITPVDSLKQMILTENGVQSG